MNEVESNDTVCCKMLEGIKWRRSRKLAREGR